MTDIVQQVLASKRLRGKRALNGLAVSQAQAGLAWGGTLNDPSA